MNRRRSVSDVEETAEVQPTRRRAVRRKPQAKAQQVPVALDSLMLAVWSPQGSTGRSTLAAALAHTFAKSNVRSGHVLLVDADSYAPAQHLIHGANEITAGILAAARLIRQERYLDQEHERVTLPVGDYRLMTGVTVADRWPELDDHASSLLIHELGQRASLNIFDVSPELDPALVEPSLGIRRNQLTLAVLQRADVVLAIANADPVSIARLIESLPRLIEAVNGRIIIVINRMRTSAIGQNAKRQILEVLSSQELAIPLEVVFVPDDPRACDESLLAGEPVTLHRNRSAFAKGVRELASRINSTHVHTARAG